ncbi:MAG: amidohydrolase [Clostridiales bacterium]|nr:amidohydrolase [Clostridiales bacterium]
MIIDFHTHCFPERIAEMAVSRVAGAAGITIVGNGTVDSLISEMDRQGIDMAVVLNIATNPRQQTNVNNFAIEINNKEGRIISFGSVNPDSDNITSELKRIKTAGLKGIKIHPDYMGVPVDDRRMIRILEECADLDLIVVTHAGFDVISPDFIHATPEGIARAVKGIRGLKLVAAHMGGNRCWEDVERYLLGRDIYFDISVESKDDIPHNLAKRIIDGHPSDKILFGSDAPWFSPAGSISLIESLGLAEEQKVNIYEHNAKKLLGIC